MNEEEKKAIVRAREHIIDPAGNYLSDEEIETLLNLTDKRQRIMKSQEKIIMEQEKEIDKYKKQEFGDLFNGKYISKDKIEQLANGIRVLGTNPDITTEEIIKEFTEKPITEEYMEEFKSRYISKDKIREILFDIGTLHDGGYIKVKIIRERLEGLLEE